MAYESMTTDPVKEVHKSEDGTTVVTCKFCDYEAKFFGHVHEGDPRYVSSAAMAVKELYSHARKAHYDYASGCFMSDEDKEERRRSRQQYRNIMGGPEETTSMNRMGL